MNHSRPLIPDKILLIFLKPSLKEERSQNYLDNLCWPLSKKKGMAMSGIEPMTSRSRGKCSTTEPALQSFPERCIRIRARWVCRRPSRSVTGTYWWASCAPWIPAAQSSCEASGTICCSTPATRCSFHVITYHIISIYKLKWCSKKECFKHCRHVKFKGTMQKWPIKP